MRPREPRINSSRFILHKRSHKLLMLLWKLRSLNSRICSIRSNTFLSGVLEERLSRYAQSSILGKEKRWTKLYQARLSREQA
jgi:hypothetical protein